MSHRGQGHKSFPPHAHGNRCQPRVADILISGLCLDPSIFRAFFDNAHQGVLAVRRPKNRQPDRLDHLGLFGVVRRRIFFRTHRPGKSAVHEMRYPSS